MSGWRCCRGRRASGSKIDINKAREILDEDHYDLKKVKDRILDYLGVLALKPDMKGPILCFVGPPGVGKTSLGHSRLRGRWAASSQRISLGGMHDEAEIRGHRRTYIGALPGQIIQSIRRAETNDPVFMLDEVDKLGRDFRGDPRRRCWRRWIRSRTTLSGTTISTCRSICRRCCLSARRTCWIPIPPPLRDRMEIIPLQGYSEEEKVHIAYRYLVPRQIKENGITAEQIEFPEQAVRHIVRHYTREAGVRKLEQVIGTVCRKQARRVAEGKTEKTRRQHAMC